MRILLIDNYDSFTYNLVQYFGELGAEVEVHRNDAIGLEEIERAAPDALVLSPGPCTPREAGISVPSLQRFAGRLPILGVCLGHQSMAFAFGGEVVRADRLMHGKTSPIQHDGRTLFRGLPNPFEATRYHSLLVQRDTLPAAFEVSAQTAEGEVMAIRHRELTLEGVQFHPESILTVCGRDLLRNFLDEARQGPRRRDA
jgi:anthranilate synthase/aminodeoxychorismate synthase-like glutamine amidotransferase